MVLLRSSMSHSLMSPSCMFLRWNSSSSTKFLGRKRGYISTTYVNLVDILSWRHAQHIRNIEASSAEHRAMFKAALNHARKIGSVDNHETIHKMSTKYDRFNPNVPQKPRRENSTSAKEEELYSKTSQYRIQLPIKVNWKSLDDHLFLRIRKDLYKMAGQSAPDKSSRVLIFHRGVGLDTTSGFYLLEKIDEVLRRRAASIYQYFMDRASRFAERRNDWFERSKREQQSSFLALQRVYSNWKAIPAELLYKLARVLNLEHVLRRAPVEFSSLNEEQSQVQVDVELEQAPEKVKDLLLDRAFSARIALSDVSISLSSFLRKITLREPTFKELVILYRLKNPPPTNNDNLPAGTVASSLETGAHEPNKSNIYIKYFRDVPMCDVKFLLPEKQVSIRRIDWLSLATMSMVAVQTSMPLILNQDVFYSKAYLAAFFVSIGYISRIISRLYSTRIYYDTLSMSMFSDQLVADGPAALSWIVYLSQQQDDKEFAIVYTALCELSMINGDRTTFCISDIQVKCNELTSKVCYGSAMNWNLDPVHALKRLRLSGLAIETTFPVTPDSAGGGSDAMFSNLKWNNSRRSFEINKLNLNRYHPVLPRDYMRSCAG